MKPEILNRIESHSRPDETRRLEVLEWGTPAELDEDGTEHVPARPMIITYSPVTLDDLATVQQLDGDNWPHRAARIVALKARDESGQRLFDMIDAVTLRTRAAPAVVSAIAMAMVGGLTVEQATKN